MNDNWINVEHFRNLIDGLARCQRSKIFDAWKPEFESLCDWAGFVIHLREKGPAGIRVWMRVPAEAVEPLWRACTEVGEGDSAHYEYDYQKLVKGAGFLWSWVQARYGKDFYFGLSDRTLEDAKALIQWAYDSRA